MVSNEQIARVLYEIADYLEVDQPSPRLRPAGGVSTSDSFRSRAYREAAKFVEHYKEELADVYKKGGEKALEDLPEIGPSMAKKIGELIETGKLGYVEKLRKKLPVNMVALNAIPGMGPKTIAKLYKEHKVRTVADFERFQHKEVARQRGALQFGGQGRWPRKRVESIARTLVNQLKKLAEVEAIEIAGSLRRKTKTIGDVDLVAASKKPEKVMAAFVNLPEVEEVYSKGDTKTLVRLKQGIDCDLRVVPPESFGAAMQYFTGPKEHSIATRRLARDRGLKLNEYGLFKNKKKLAGKTEKEIYDVLGLKLELPEERTGKLLRSGNVLVTLEG